MLIVDRIRSSFISLCNYKFYKKKYLILQSDNMVITAYDSINYYFDTQLVGKKISNPLVEIIMY